MTTEFVARSHMPVPGEELLAWHLRPGAFERLLPPWDSTRVVARTGSIEDDSMRMRLSVPLAGPLRGTWQVRMERFDPERGFVDVAERGPLRSWEHRHVMLAVDERRSMLEDRIAYQLPLGPAGAAASAGPVRRRLDTTFGWRHFTLAADLEAHARAAARMGDARPLRVAIAGADGLVGRTLWSYLATGGHRPFQLVTAGELAGAPPAGPPPWAMYDLPPDLLPAGALDGRHRLEGVDALVVVALPAPFAPTLHDDVVAALAELLDGLDVPPRVVVVASSLKGSDMRPLVERARRAGSRVVEARAGLVTTPAAGALARMLPRLRAGMGGLLRHADEWWSWVTTDDLVAALEWCVACNELEGEVDVVAPQRVHARDFVRAAARAVDRPVPVDVAARALRRLRRGPAAPHDVPPPSPGPTAERLLESGFRFRTPRVKDAMQALLGQVRAPVEPLPEHLRGHGSA